MLQYCFTNSVDILTNHHVGISNALLYTVDKLPTQIFFEEILVYNWQNSVRWDCNTFCLLVCLPRLLFECRSRGAMKSPQDENFSGLLRLFNGVGNASCFHRAHNPPILQFRPPLFTRLLVYVWSKSVKCFLNVRHFNARLHLSSFTPCRAAWDQR